MTYFDTLYSASFNGASFFVREQSGHFGRKIAAHTYPYRDANYNEDLGKQPREFEIEGYIVGDDVTTQLQWMINVCEQPGPGVLIHPSLGVMYVNLIGGLRTKESYEHGRQVVLHFRFIESGQSLFPALLTSTFNLVGGSIGNLNLASALDYVAKVQSAVSLGASVVSKGIIAVTSFVAVGGGLVKTATNIAGTLKSLVGAFGRFSGGNTGSTASTIVGSLGSAGGVAAQVAGLIAAGAQARFNVEVAAEQTIATAGSGTPSELATASQTYVGVVLAGVTDPAQAVQIFSQLATFTVADQPGNSAIVQAQNTLQSGVGDLSRRCAIAAMAQAAALYQPTSYDDAENVRGILCGIIDAEILIAGDQGQDNTFLALKQLRSAVVQDLTTRGASLAPLVQVQFGHSLPALAVAYRLYKDINRTDQVTAFANPRHPAFLPNSFKVLAS